MARDMRKGFPAVEGYFGAASVQAYTQLVNCIAEGVQYPALP